MSAKTSFLLRLDPRILDAVKLWAAEERRSANSQIEFVLQRALAESQRLAAAPARGIAAQTESRIDNEHVASR